MRRQEPDARLATKMEFTGNRGFLDVCKKMHDLLLKTDKLLADVAIEYALGRVSGDELESLSENVEELRELADTIFLSALGVARSRPRESE